MKARNANREVDEDRGERITKLIAAKGYDQYGGMTKLAREVGVSRGMPYEWKEGFGIHVDHVEKLAEVLGSTVTYILSGSEPDFPPPELLDHPDLEDL